MDGHIPARPYLRSHDPHLPVLLSTLIKNVVLSFFGMNAYMPFTTQIVKAKFPRYLDSTEISGVTWGVGVLGVDQICTLPKPRPPHSHRQRPSHLQPDPQVKSLGFGERHRQLHNTNTSVGTHQTGWTEQTPAKPHEHTSLTQNSLAKLGPGLNAPMVRHSLHAFSFTQPFSGNRQYKISYWACYGAGLRGGRDKGDCGGIGAGMLSGCNNPHEQLCNPVFR